MNTRIVGSSNRLIRRFLIFVGIAFAVGSSWAQVAPVETLVQDTLYRADGTVAHGTLTIRWNSFTSSGGEAVAAGEVTVKTNANGGIAIPLIANTGSSPSGTYYRVFMKLDDGTTSEELWVVPEVATTTIAAIRAKVAPQAVAAQFVSRDYVDTALAAVDATLATVAPATLVHLAGAETIVGAKTFTVSPQVPAPASAGSAVDKGYVDQGFAGLATVASTGNYNDLLNKPPSANLGAPGAIGLVTPGTVNATAYSVNGTALASANLSDAGSLAKTGQANTFSQPQTVTFTGSDTAAAALMVNASSSSISTNPVVKVALPPSGGQHAMQAINGSDSKAWYSLEYNAGGTGLPGIGLGPGGSAARDAFLYRSAANALMTPGSFTAAQVNGTVQIAPGLNGVVGNGSSSGGTDDTAAIAALFTAAGNGTDILVSPGTYGVCGLQIPDGMHLRGLGGSCWGFAPSTCPVLFTYSSTCASPSTTPVFHVVSKTGSDSTLMLNGPVIENIGIWDNTNSGAGGGGLGALWSDNVVKGTLRKVSAFGFTMTGAYGFDFTQYNGSSDQSYWMVEQPSVRGADTGVILDGLSDGMIIEGGEIAQVNTGIKTNTTYSQVNEATVIGTSFELNTNGTCADISTQGMHFQGRCEETGTLHTGIGVHLESTAAHNYINPTLNENGVGVQAEAGSYGNEIHLANLNGVTTSKVELGNNEWAIPGSESTYNDSEGGYSSLYGYFSGASVLNSNTTSVQSGLLGRYGALLRNSPKAYFLLGVGGVVSTGTTTLTVTTPSSYGMVAGEMVFLKGMVLSGGTATISGPCTGLVVVTGTQFTCTFGSAPAAGTYNYGSMWAAGGLWESGINSTQASVGAGAMNFSAAGGTATGAVASGFHFNPAGSSVGTIVGTCDTTTVSNTFTPTQCIKITPTATTVPSLTFGDGTAQTSAAVVTTPEHYGAQHDGVIVTDAGCSAGSTTITAPSSKPFTSASVGKTIAINGCGQYTPFSTSPNGNLTPVTLVSTITAYNSNQSVTIATPAAVNTGTTTSITYVSGGTVTGSNAQTCTLTLANGGTATLQLSGTSIPSGTTANIVTLDTGESSAPTSATLSNGTATCSGTATITSTIAPATVSGQWAAFGTNDHDAIQSCITAAASVNGHCHLYDGANYIVGTNASGTGNLSFTPPIDHMLLDGRANVIAAYSSPFNGYNGSLFWLYSTFTENVCGSGTLLYCPMPSTPIAKGATSFTALNSADAALLSPGEYVMVMESYSSALSYIDWMQVKSVSGTTVNVVQPFRQAFPCSETQGPNMGCQFWGVPSLVNGVTIRDLTVTIPNTVNSSLGPWSGSTTYAVGAIVTYGGSSWIALVSNTNVTPVAGVTWAVQTSAQASNAFITGGSRNTTFDNVICRNASQECIGSVYDSHMTLTNTKFLAEANASEFAASVDLAIEPGSVFAKEASPLTSNAGGCNLGTSGIFLDIATGFYSISGAQVQQACMNGIVLEFGSHDGSIVNSNIGWIEQSTADPATTSAGVYGLGAYRTLIAGNTFAGAASANAKAVSFTSMSSNPTILSAQNLVTGNAITATDFAAGAFYSNGATDQYISPTPGSSQMQFSGGISGPVATAQLTVGSGSAITGNQGTGASVQHSTGTTTTNDCVKFDANGNTVDSGAQCNAGPAISANYGDMMCAEAADSTIGAVSVTGVSSTSSTMIYTVASVPTYFYAGAIVQAQGNTTTAYNGGPFTVASTTATTIVVTSALNPGAGTAGGTISLYCGNQSSDATSTSKYTFTNNYSVPANSIQAGSSYRLSGQYSMFSSSAAPYFSLLLYYNTTNVWAPGGTPSIVSGMTGQAGEIALDVYAVSSSLLVPALLGWTPTTAGSATLNNNRSPLAVSTTATAPFQIEGYWNATGVASGTYSSGGTITGSTGQTCTLTSFNDSSTATATVALTGTNTIAASTALTITSRGQGATAAPTTATLGNGTATCSGTATIATVLGGAPGNAILLYDFQRRQ
jgi:hypothetical protein